MPVYKRIFTLCTGADRIDDGASSSKMPHKFPNSIMTIGRKSNRAPRFTTNATVEEGEGSFEMLNDVERLTPPGYANKQHSVVSSHKEGSTSSLEDLPSDRIRVKKEMRWTQGNNGV